MELSIVEKQIKLNLREQIKIHINRTIETKVKSISKRTQSKIKFKINNYMLNKLIYSFNQSEMKLIA